MKHTWNTFKGKVKDMTQEQKEELLKELHSTYVIEYTKAHRGGNVKTMNLWLLKRQIAYMKTILNEKGYGYYPR